MANFSAKFERINFGCEKIKITNTQNIWASIRIMSKYSILVQGKFLLHLTAACITGFAHRTPLMVAVIKIYRH